MKRVARGARGELVPVRLPSPAALFGERAARLEALAPGHAAEGWLRLLARLARAQAAAAEAPPGGPRLGALPAVLAAARAAPLPGPAADAVAWLERAPAAELEALAAEVEAGRPRDLARAPFVGAALQVHAASAAAALDPASLPPGSGRCPACGAAPVVSVLLGDDRLRYLACGLCGAEWHLPRVRCAGCGDTASVTYLAPEGALAGVRAEACDACGAYFKLLDLAEAHGAEPVADDAASIAIDLLVEERGYAPLGINPLAPRGGGGVAPRGRAEGSSA